MSFLKYLKLLFTPFFFHYKFSKVVLRSLLVEHDIFYSFLFINFLKRKKFNTVKICSAKTNELSGEKLNTENMKK